MKGIDMIRGLAFRPLEEIIGAAPTFSAWKADVLTDKLYLHKGADRLNP